MPGWAEAEGVPAELVRAECLMDYDPQRHPAGMACGRSCPASQLDDIVPTYWRCPSCLGLRGPSRDPSVAPCCPGLGWLAGGAGLQAHQSPPGARPLHGQDPFI